jgi:hypothetical protein
MYAKTYLAAVHFGVDHSIKPSNIAQTQRKSDKATSAGPKSDMCMVVNADFGNATEAAPLVRTVTSSL